MQRWIRQTLARPGTRMFGIALAAGLLGGIAGAAFIGLLHVFQRGLWPTHWSLAAHGLVLVAVGVTVGVLSRMLGSPGDVELLVDNIHVAGGADDLRQLPSLLPISLLCIALGGALRPEAPLVQTTGTVGSWAARRFGLDPTGVRIITITGMAAGFTVLFGVWRSGSSSVTTPRSSSSTGPSRPTSSPEPPTPTTAAISAWA